MPADWLDKANPRALYDRINVPPFYFPRIAGPAAYRAGQSTIIGASKAKSPAGFYQRFIGYLGLTEQWEKARKPLKILGKTGVMR